MNVSLEQAVYRLVMNSDIFTKFVLLILLVMSVISWAIMIQKLLFVSSYKSSIISFVKSLTSQGNKAYIEDSCVHFSSGSARTLPILILKIIRSQAQGKIVSSPSAIINNAVMHEANKLERGLGVLAITANISPLLGLLGTVWGILSAFVNIGQQGSANIAVVAPGIAASLITTFAGLCVAIPAMAAHNFLTVSVNNCLDNLDRVVEFSNSVIE